MTNRFLPTFVTFPANTTVNAVGKLRPKFKRSSYLMLDIKENCTRVIFAVKGHAVGASVLPFGFEILSDKKVVAEDMLFDHSFADLTVINANERAKAKSLTMMAEDRSQTELEPGDVVNIDGSITKEDGTVIQTDGTIIRPDGTVVPPVENAQDDDGLVTGDDSNAQGDEDDDGTPVEQGGFKAYQRVARKLPKFMQRPTPTTRVTSCTKTSAFLSSGHLVTFAETTNLQPLPSRNLCLSTCLPSTTFCLNASTPTKPSRR